MGLRKRTWEILGAAAEGDRASKFFDIFITGLIIANVTAVVIDSVPAVHERFALPLHRFEVFSVLVFTAEYLLRLWACTMEERYRHPLRGRLRFALTPLAVIDLLAVLPFYIPYTKLDLRIIRLFRTVRLLRLAKLGRYYSSAFLIINVFRSKKSELMVIFGTLMFLLVISASLMYYCENPVQPDKFPSIPAAMWWAMTTFTTVGYGDLYPVTAMGRLFGSVVEVLGIGMFALPTALLGAGFLEEMQKRKQHRTCPHCGKEIE